MYTHNLELHGLSFKFDGSNLEVNTNGRDVTLCVGIICEPEQQAGLGKTKKV